MSVEERVRMERINLMVMETAWQHLDNWDTYCLINCLLALRMPDGSILEFIDK